MWLVFLVVVVVLCFTFQSFFCKLFSDHYAGEEEASTPVFSLLFGLVIGGVTLAVNGFSYHPSSSTLLLGLLTAVMLFFYNLALIRASRLGSYSFLMICMLFGGTILPMIVGVVFLGETLAPLQIGAIVLMLAAFVVMNIKGISLKGVGAAYYIWCAVLFVSNGLFSTFMNTQQKLMNAQERPEMITTAYLGLAVLAGLYHLVTRRGKVVRDYKMGRKSLIYVLLCCAVATLAVNMLMYVLSMVGSGVLFTINNGSVLALSIVFSFIFFKEKPLKNQVIGMGMSLISIVLLSI